MSRKGGAPGNLKPFVKGNDPRRNLKGAPPILPELKDALHAILSEQVKGKTKLEMVLRSLQRRAVKGDVRAIQELLDRFYGKIKQNYAFEGLPKDISINVLSKESADKLKNFLKNDEPD